MTRLVSSRTVASALLPALLLAGCSSRAPSAEFSAQAERLHDESLSSAVARDADLNDYFQQLGQRLARGARGAAPNTAGEAFLAQIQAHLVASPVVNAFTTGGPHVYVYNGLFQVCESEEELAAAMAHALAHAVSLDVESVDLQPAADRPLPAVVWEFVTHRFSAGQERAAHELGYAIYVRGGWDPNKYQNVYQRLADRYGGPSAPDRLPLSAKAALAIDLAAGAGRDWRKPPVADPRTFLALRRQAASFRGDTLAPGGQIRESQLFLLALPNCLLSDDLPEQRRAQDMLRPPPPPAAPLEPN